MNQMSEKERMSYLFLNKSEPTPEEKKTEDLIDDKKFDKTSKKNIK